MKKTILGIISVLIFLSLMLFAAGKLTGKEKCERDCKYSSIFTKECNSENSLCKAACKETRLSCLNESKADYGECKTDCRSLLTTNKKAFSPCMRSCYSVYYNQTKICKQNDKLCNSACLAIFKGCKPGKVTECKADCKPECMTAQDCRELACPNENGFVHEQCIDGSCVLQGNLRKMCVTECVNLGGAGPNPSLGPMDPNGNKTCCNNLTALIPKDSCSVCLSSEMPCPTIVGAGTMCIACGDGICDSKYENSCNCPSDCIKPVCEDFRYSTCPEGCVKNCVPSVCSPEGICTADCEGQGSCTTPPSPCEGEEQDGCYLPQ